MYYINYSRKRDLNIDLIGDGLNGLSKEFKFTAFAFNFDWYGIGAHSDNSENRQNGELHGAAAFTMQI